MCAVVRQGAATAKAPTRAAAGSKKKASAAKKSKAGTKRVAGAGKIVANDLPSFSRQLSAMLAAGVPVVESLEALEDQTDNEKFKPVIETVRNNIENGASFSEALAPFPSIFDELYVNMVRAGEQGGVLAETIARIATFLENSAKLRRKVKSAMTYPTVVVIIALGIALLMITFIVPVFAAMFEDFGAKLPAPTQFLVNVGNNFKKYGIFAILGFGGFGFLYKRWINTPGGRLIMDKFYLRLPVIGHLCQLVAVSRFARTFAQLIRSGVPILSSLEIVSGATGNSAIGNVIEGARDTVERGEPLSVALKPSDYFPRMLIQMMQAGEKTGKVDEMMESIADYYEDEVETMLGGLTSMLEPVLMVFLGITIGGIVICMFLPVFKMSEVVQF